MKQNFKPYRRECHAVWQFFGEWLPPAEVVKRDPDAPFLVQDVIDRANRLLAVVRERRDHRHPFHWLYDINQLRTLQWMLSGERELLDELTHTQH